MSPHARPDSAIGGPTRGVSGVVLAGGQSRRMFKAEGGGDKGLLDIAGRPMLAHVIERLSPQVTALAINANGDPQRLRAFGCAILPDTVGGFAGPLAGVLTGMRWAAAATPRARWIATVSADAPLVPADLVARLVAALDGRPDTAIAIANSKGELHPVIGLWPVALADDLQQALESGVRKVLAWTDRHGTVPVEFGMAAIAGRQVDPFFNANTPAELAELRAIMAACSPAPQPAADVEVRNDG